MSASIFVGSTVKLLKAIMDLNGNAQVLSGSVDPTSSATSAPKGSLYLSTSTGFLYTKTDAGSSTNWTQLGTGVFATGSVSAPGIAFSGDSNTGFYQNTGDEVRVATGGAEHLAVTTTGVIINGTTTSDSNLGTISSVKHTGYYEGSFSIAFDTGAWAAGHTLAFKYIKNGKNVILSVPQSIFAAGAAAASISASTDLIPSGLRPTTQIIQSFLAYDASAIVNMPTGRVDITSGGAISFSKAPDGTSNFTTLLNCGWIGPFTISYTTA